MDLIEKIMLSIIAIILMGALMGMILVGVDVFNKVTGKKCSNKYKDTEYTISGGCKVKYEGQYIPESLYEKAFTQNIKIK